MELKDVKNGDGFWGREKYCMYTNGNPDLEIKLFRKIEGKIFVADNWEGVIEEDLEVIEILKQPRK